MHPRSNVKTLATGTDIGHLEQTLGRELDMHIDISERATTAGSWCCGVFSSHPTSQIRDLIAQVLRKSLDILIIPTSVRLPNFHVEPVCLEPSTLDVHTHIASVPGSTGSTEVDILPVVALSKEAPPRVWLIRTGVQIAIRFELVHVNTKDLVKSLGISSHLTSCFAVVVMRDPLC